MPADRYCREIETYLCRKNDGHLIRIVGPSFDMVCGWARQGIPLKLVFHGIDRCFKRYYARGPRRRPVRIDFCETDVLEVFDEWRHAVGVACVPAAEADVADESASAPPLPGRRRRSLAGHIDGVIGRLIARRTNPATPALDAEISGMIDRLERIRDAAAQSRGHARARIIHELAEFDRMFGAAVRDNCPPDLRAVLWGDAAADLEPFRQRMPIPAYEQALASSVDRLLRDRLELPRIAYE